MLENEKNWKSTSEAAESPNGSPPRPSSEQALRHSGKSAEASRSALTKRPKKGPPLTAPPRGDKSGGSAPPDVDKIGTRNASQKPSGAGDIEITRATCRFRLRFDDEKKVDGKWPAADPRRKALFDARNQVVRASNLLCRRLWRIDGDALDAFQLEHARLPKKAKEWPKPKLKDTLFEGKALRGGYGLIRQAVPELSPGIASAVARAVEKKWGQERFDALIRGKRTPPHYRDTCPVPVRKQEVQIHLHKERFCLSVPFEADPNREGKRLTFDIELRDDFHRNVIQNIAEGIWRHGEVKFEQDSKRPKRWYARISYTRKIQRVHGGKTGAVNRGIKFFFAAITSSGEEWMLDGHGIEAHLRAIQNRRRRYQNEAKASARAGRGRQRILRPIEPLIAKGQRWRQTRCQVIARRLAKWFHDRGVTEVVIEDFQGIRRGEPERLKGGERQWRRVQEWPYYQLQMRLESCLAEYGIATTIIEPNYISQTCPLCGNTDEKNRDLQRWRLKCTDPNCNYNRKLDLAAAHNVMVRGLAKDEAQPPEPRGKKKHTPRDTRKMSGSRGKAVRTSPVRNINKLDKTKKGKKRTSRKSPRKPT